ncbi:hypothetical protein CW751_02715 [Brumimicrobium salinarum]|uniref:Outer membrane protein beta-barrel domain-containing protein n=1 Tax=Brumimicrobium salinarum TaxID=2058658 RepID=A0A2I0R6P9_9FLAO|nr:hypothetical protein [Brumimicrobium salinarum]PKR82261.1 hypothetical protein CW751_02715 [Brumimicrobium salinarum]
MRVVFLLIIIFTSGIYPVFSQRKTKLNTNGQGALFGQLGINRSFYSTANVEINSNNYNFTLENTSIKDNIQTKEESSLFSSESPQISIKLGYFIKPKWALTLSFDRYNTFFEDNQNVRLNGTFAPGSHSIYTGSVDEEILLTQDQFNIAQSKGINYFAFGFQRNDMLVKTRKAKFALHAIYGAKLGALFTTVDFTYDDFTTQNLSSLSGFGASAEVGFRFEFFQHVYLQVGLNGGVLNQNKILLSDDESRTAKQTVGFISPHFSLGFNVFASSKNNCGTCPQW